LERATHLLAQCVGFPDCEILPGDHCRLDLAFQMMPHLPCIIGSSSLTIYRLVPDELMKLITY
jgi:hypothetical protein